MSYPQTNSDDAAAPRARATNVRLAVLMIATAMSVLLYLDRFCVSFAADFIKEDLRLTQEEVGYFLSAFFFSYALAQVPSGWLSDRYGARIMLTIYIVVWSIFTALIGAVNSLALLLITRLACGIGQAGAYPTGASVISKWIPFCNRGAASAWVALGGRIGGAIAPLLTALLIVAFVPIDTPVELKSNDIFDGPRLCAKLCPVENADSNVEGRTSPQNDGLTKPSPAGQHIWNLIQPEYHPAICANAQKYRTLESQRVASPVQQQLADLHLDSQDESSLVAGLNGLLDSSEVYDEAAFKSANLPSEAIDLLKKSKSSTLPSVEQRRLDRLLLEAAFPGEIAKLYTRGWRPVMFVYGFAGLFVAALVWIVFRDRPEAHPWCNAAECELIESGRPENAPSPHGRPGMIPFRRLIKSGSMWLDCFGQVGTNIGWIFLVTWLPRYLISQHDVPVLERGLMAMVPLLAGIVGMFFGGRLTDWLTSQLGVRWGRSLPMSATKLLAAGGYGFCLWFSTFGAESRLNSPWLYVAAFSLVSFATDLGVPAVWAFKQDVGGRYVGSILGWGNMWGNLGASIAPPIYSYYLGENPGLAQWNNMFIVCIVAFLLAGLCGLGVNATKPIAPPDE